MYGGGVGGGCYFNGSHFITFFNFVDHYAFLDAKFSRIIVVQVSLGGRRSVALSVYCVGAVVGWCQLR